MMSGIASKQVEGGQGGRLAHILASVEAGRWVIRFATLFCLFFLYLRISVA